MIDQPQMNRVALANQLPLNKVAKTFVPDDWASPAAPRRDGGRLRIEFFDIDNSKLLTYTLTYLHNKCHLCRCIDE
jgi:hypothetical protein